MAKKPKTFPRHDDMDKEASLGQTAAEFLLWMAEEEEKRGNTENAERLRKEAAKGLKKKEG